MALSKKSKVALFAGILTVLVSKSINRFLFSEPNKIREYIILMVTLCVALIIANKFFLKESK